MMRDKVKFKMELDTWMRYLQEDFAEFVYMQIEDGFDSKFMTAGEFLADCAKSYTELLILKGKQ